MSKHEACKDYFESQSALKQENFIATDQGRAQDRGNSYQAGYKSKEKNSKKHNTNLNLIALKIYL